MTRPTGPGAAPRRAGRLLLLGCAVLAACPAAPEGSTAAAPAPRAPAEAPPSPGVLTALARVPGGAFRPLFGPADAAPAQVAPFDLGVHAVTNEQFLAFVTASPTWRRSRAPRLFADEGYLRAWAGDLDLGGLSPQAPVTCVSWFAARAYARWAGRRLPITAEWELAASSPPRGREEADLRALVADWHARPTPAALPPVRSTYESQDGVWDLHGLIWEWVDDFNALPAGESRTDPGRDRALFCGPGALGASDRSDYPAFMRFAMRSSLRGNYTVSSLGFRCAASPAEPATPADRGP